MDIREMSLNLITAAEIVAAAVCKQLAPKKDMISQSAAYKRYGRRWITAHKKMLTPTYQGTVNQSRVFYSILEIEAIRKTEQGLPTLKK